MSTPSDTLLTLSSARNRRGRALSQSVLSVLLLLYDGFAVALPGFLIQLSYVGDAVAGRTSLYATAIIAFTAFLLQIMYSLGMYRFSRIVDPMPYLGRVIAAASLVFLIMIAAGFALKISSEFSRVWAFSWFLTATFTLTLGRLAIAMYLRRLAARGWLRRQIAIFGGGAPGEQLLAYLNGKSNPWDDVVGVFDDRTSRTAPTVQGLPYLGGVQELLDYGSRHRLDEVIVALPWSADDRILHLMRSLTALPVNVKLSPEIVGGKIIHRRVSEEFGVPMLEVLEKPLSGWGVFGKAVFDLILGGVLLLLAAPIMTVIALCIKLESRGPVFFRQKRYGFKNQLIEIYKFRTMYADLADHDAERLTDRDDPRVTRVGAVLRRLSLDELPQLLNVIRGEMSVVGPRPHAIKAKAGGRLYEDVVDGYAVRHKVKPGITGWAQVNGWRGNTETEGALVNRVEHDLFYIENWSIRLDAKILLLTVWAVIRGENSY